MRLLIKTHPNMPTPDWTRHSVSAFGPGKPRGTPWSSRSPVDRGDAQRLAAAHPPRHSLGSGFQEKILGKAGTPSHIDPRHVSEEQQEELEGDAGKNRGAGRTALEDHLGKGGLRTIRLRNEEGQHEKEQLRWSTERA